MMNLKVLMVALLIGVFAGCSNNTTTNEKYADVVQMHKDIYVDLDVNGYVFDYVLENLEEYIEGDITEEKIVSCVKNTIDDFNTQLDDIEPYEVDDETNELLVGNDINPEDFEQFANCKTAQLTEMIAQLEKINDILTVQTGDTQKDTLKFIEEKYSNIQENYQKYYFYKYFNYFFSSWGAVQTRHAQDSLKPELREYIDEDFVWENDKEVLDKNIAGYLAEIENDLKAVEELDLGSEAVLE